MMLFSHQGGEKMEKNKTRINISMPNDLHEYVKEQAKKLGIPTSTMYVIIINQYRMNDDALQTFKALQNIQKGD